MNKISISAHTPISAKDRISEIDIIRGFALFGVLLVNVVAFNYTLPAHLQGVTPLTNPLHLGTAIDRLSAVLIQLFAEGKFYTIFSFLFGLGFYIFISRAEEKGLNSKKLFKRRMLALFGFGILNLILVWYGDILHVYGLGGFLLVLFRNKSERSLKKWVIVLLVISTVFGSFMAYSPLAIQEHMGDVHFTDSSEAVSQSFQVFREGSFIEIVQYRLANEVPMILVYLLFIIPKTLAMFLIGMLFAKRNVFKDFKSNEKFITKMWKITGVLGSLTLIIKVLSGYPVLAIGHPIQNPFLFTLVFELGTVLISLFYITSLIKLLRKSSVKNILSPLQFVGRMALTNYLTQCIVCALVFYGFGLGYIGEMSIFTGVIFTLSLFILQMVISTIWFKHFRFGPFEWIWRKFTYGRA